MAESKAPHPLERRTGARRPILLPVRLAVISAGTSKESTLSAIAATCYGLVYDVSVEGMQIEVTGVVAKHFLSDDQLTGTVQMGFMHTELRRKGDCLGRVQWSKAATQRGACILGVKFDTPMTPAEVEMIASYGPLSPPKAKASPFIVQGTLGVVALALAIGFVVARDQLRDQEAATAAMTRERDDKVRQVGDCRVELDRATAALAARTAAPTPAPTPAIQGDAGAGDHDAGPHARAD